jgi:hypothetical protein
MVLFHEAMEMFRRRDFENSFQRFERAAAKGHEESIWIVSVLKDVAMEKNTLKQAFTKTEEPLGWYFAGLLSDVGGREQFDFYKKSAEGGCSWGQIWYAWYFRYGGGFAEKDENVYVGWLEKAANQNNPEAMDRLGDWFRDEVDDKEKAAEYYCDGAELGWKDSMASFGSLLSDGVGCEKDLRQAIMWSAKSGHARLFWDPLESLKRLLERGATGALDCDFDQLCYALGWGLYWYKYGNEDWDEQSDENKAYANRCLDYYCSCVELQQKSIFTFLLFWNRTTGVKEPGQMITKMVWEGKETNVLLRFGEKRESRGCILF